MCMMDWRIGRLIRSSVSNYASVAAASAGLKANPQRVKLEIILASPILPLFDSVGQSNPSMVVASGSKVVRVLDVFNKVYSVSLLTDGDAPTLDYVLTDVDYSDAITIIEWTLPEEVLCEALESFKREYPKWPK